MITILLSLFIELLWAHGGDKPGPHSGKVAMPGAYHVEVLRPSTNTFHIYVLDMDFKDKTLERSSVKAQIKRNSKDILLACELKKFYICKSPLKLKSQEVLLVDSSLGEMKGNQASFEFDAETTKTDH